MRIFIDTSAFYALLDRDDDDHIEYIATEIHRSWISALLSAAKGNLSLVDCVSFEVMRSL